MLRETLCKLFRIVNLNYSFRRKISNQLYILMFHQINDKNLRFYPAIPTRIFDQICNFLSARFNVIHISDIEDYFAKTRKPAFIISFDDGHYDILQNAYPVLEKYNLKFNINIVTESLETGFPQDSVMVYDVLNNTEKREYINTEIASEPIRISINRDAPSKTEIEFSKLFRRLNKQQRHLTRKDIVNKLGNAATRFSRVLSKEDVVYLEKKGAEVGSHTHSHAILSNIDISEIEFELMHSKNVLENLCGKKIDIIAFPQGKCNEMVIQKSLELGYKYLLLTDERKNTITNPKDSKFYRIGLYYKTLDENLAKIFGLYDILHKFKK